MYVCVYFVCFCFILHSCYIAVSMVGWTWWDWSLILRTYIPSVIWHCCLGHMTCKNLFPIWPIMCLVRHQSLYLSITMTVSVHFPEGIWSNWLFAASQKMVLCSSSSVLVRKFFSILWQEVFYIDRNVVFIFKSKK